MKSYKIHITKMALADMQEIYNYISMNLSTPDSAMNQYQRIAKAIQSLVTFPKRTRVYRSKSGKQIRRLLIDYYSILYIVSKDTVTILEVVYSASNIDNHLSRY